MEQYLVLHISYLYHMIKRPIRDILSCSKSYEMNIVVFYE